MASLLYESIYSSLLSKIKDYDVLTDTIEDTESKFNEYLHSAISKPYCRRLFSAVEFDDENNEITYTLKKATDESQDSDFVTEMLSLGMLIEWYEPQLNSKLLTQQMITSSKESKWYSQQQHLSTMQSVYDSAVKKQRDLIRDRGFIYNQYFGGQDG